MITLTPAAAKQIRASAEQGDMQGLAMRIAAKRNPDGSLHYAMGFDDTRLEGDMHIDADGIEIVVSQPGPAGRDDRGLCRDRTGHLPVHFPEPQ